MFSDAFVGHIPDLGLLLDVYASYVHLKLMHVVSCFQNFEDFIKFWSCLKVIKNYFEFAGQNLV